MRVKQIRIVMPPRMRPSSIADARQIAETVVKNLAGMPAQAGVPAITVQGLGRPAQHLHHDIAVATRSAAGGKRQGV